MPLLKLFRVLKKMGARVEDLEIHQEDVPHNGFTPKSMWMRIDTTKSTVDPEKMMVLLSRFAPLNSLSIKEITFSAFQAGQRNRKKAERKHGQRLIFSARSQQANEFLAKLHGELA